MVNEKHKLEEIQELSRSGEDELVEEKLKAYLSEYPNSLVATLMLGGLYFNQEKYNDAMPLFKTVIKEKPLEPKASIALFHCLWERNEKLDGMQLIEMFIENADENDCKNSETIESFKSIKAELIEKSIWET